MKHLLESIRLQIYDRLSSPLFGAFAIAWLAWNHAYLLILCSDEYIGSRLDLARTSVFPDWQTIAWRGFFLPLASSVAFILIYPYPSKWLFAYWHRKQQELKELRNKIEGETALTIEESRRIRLLLLQTQTEYEETLRKQSELIEALQSEIKTNKKSTPSSGNITINNASEKTSKEQLSKQTASLSQAFSQQIDPGVMRILMLLAESGGSEFNDVVYSNLNEPRVKMDYYIDQAKSLQLITQGSAYRGNVMASNLQLTERGRKYAVDAKLI